MNRSEVERALRMARTYLAEQLSWFAPAVYAARLVISEACPFAAAVDQGMRVYFNPRLIGTLLDQKDSLAKAMPELAWLWFHEIAHVLREHGQRAREKNAQHDIWNVAGDLEINDADIAGLALPQIFHSLFPRTFHLPDGKLAEFYYDQLLDQRRKQPPQRSEAGSRTGGEPESGKDSQDSPDDLEEEESLSGTPEEAGGKDSRDSPDDLDEGSGVHGEERPWELPADDAQTPPLTEVECEVVRRAVAEEISRHKERGTVPAGWARWAEEVLTPKVDWREVLKRRVRGAITVGTGQRVDYSFHRPHRRGSVYAPFLPPSLRGDFVPRVACVVDTSGSISEMELGQALAEVRAVLESLRIPITVIPCDAVPYEPVRIFTRSDFLTLLTHLPGGGGTDMVKGIEAAMRLEPPPDTVIVLTDGYTPFPDAPYKIPVLFGLFELEGEMTPPQPPIPPWRREDVIIIPVHRL